MAFAVRGAAKVVWDAVGGCCRYNFGVKSCKSRTVKTAPAAKGMLQISATAGVLASTQELTESIGRLRVSRVWSGCCATFTQPCDPFTEVAPLLS